MDNALTDVSKEYTPIVDYILSISKAAFEMSKGFVDIFKDILDYQGFDKLFSCNFFRKDMFTFMDIIVHDFHDDCRNICIGTFIASGISYIGLFFLMSSIYRHGHKHLRRNNPDDYAAVESD